MKASRDMARGRPVAAVLALAGLGWLAGPVPAASADLPAPAPVAPAAEPASADWHYQLSLYGWATALNGDVGVRNLPTESIDMPFSDVLRNLDGALMGSIFANNGRWLVLGDVVYAKLSHSETVDAYGGSNLDVGLSEIIATGAVGYMLPTGRPGLDFAITGGARYMRLKANESFSPLLSPLFLSASQTKSWIDPTVGFFAHWAVNEKWFVNAIADIGGFGVGSKLSSTGYLGVGYMWTAGFSTALGYRYLYEDYEGPSDATGSFRYNVTTHGPTVSFAWHF